MRARRKAKRRRRRLYICVDPGIAGTGVAVLSTPPLRLLSTEVLRSPTERSWLDRCFWIAKEFQHILQEHSYRAPGTLGAIGPAEPLTVYVETPSLWGASGRGYAAAASGDLLRLAALAGMIALTCRRLRVPFVEVGVTEWKGQWPKSVVKKRVMEAFNLKKVPNHAADAAGIGLWVAGRM